MSLLSKMMRIAGRNPVGDATAIKVNTEGHLISDISDDATRVLGQVALTGSIEEHMWVDGDAEPTPTAARAIGLVFDPGTDDVTVKIWTGAAWEVM